MTKRKIKDERHFAIESGGKNNVNGLEDAKNASDLDPEQVEKEFLDILNYERKQRGNLLGSFEGEKYIIPQDILEELKRLPKKFGELDENIARVSTELGEFVLNFRIDFEMDPSFCKAKLFLIEIENRLDDDVKHLTLVDEFEDVYKPDFREYVFGIWKVYYDENYYDKNDILYRYLHMQNEELLFRRELTAVLSQLYVVRMLAFLDKLGELGEKIRFDFKLMMEENSLKDPSFAQNFEFQKRLLDMFINKHNALPLILKSQEGMMILKGYSTPMKNIRDKTYPTIINQTAGGKKEEKKSATKKTDNAKPKPKVKASQPVKKSKPFTVDWSKLPSIVSNTKAKQEEKKKIIGALEKKSNTPVQHITEKPQQEKQNLRRPQHKVKNDSRVFSLFDAVGEQKPLEIVNSGEAEREINSSQNQIGPIKSSEEKKKDVVIEKDKDFIR